MRKFFVLVSFVGVLSSIGTAAAFAGAPLPPSPIDPPVVIYVGTFSDFIAPTTSRNGSIAITLPAGAPGAPIRKVTVTLTRSTYISYATTGRILDGERGSVRAVITGSSPVATMVVVAGRSIGGIKPPPPPPAP